VLARMATEGGEEKTMCEAWRKQTCSVPGIEVSDAKVHFYILALSATPFLHLIITLYYKQRTHNIINYMFKNFIRQSVVSTSCI
jgi:hypothetical protein